MLAAFLAAASAMPALAEEAAPVACGHDSARYELGKLTVWVVRRGTFEKEEPLRPLTPEKLVALQVIVNGRDATAYGPDYANLQQGAAARDLEHDGRLAWDGADGLPPQFSVVAPDGKPLFGPLKFVACGQAPAASARPAAPARKPVARARDNRPGAPAAEGGQPGGSRLPQGALPGLDLPKGR